MPDRYTFPGFVAFLEAAQAGVDDPSTLSHARRQPALQALASLCAQATDAAPQHRADILGHAAKARDGLAIALDAADAILAEVGDALDVDARPSEVAVLRARVAGLEALAVEGEKVAARLAATLDERDTLRARVAGLEADVARLTPPAPTAAPEPAPAAPEPAPAEAPARKATKGLDTPPK